MPDPTRDDILNSVQHGELSPNDEEETAARLGFGPFAQRADADLFDPVDEAFWTVPMAIAWIAWRSVDRVRDVWDAFRAACWDWTLKEWRAAPDGKVRKGHLLENRPPATLLTLTVMDASMQSAGLLPVDSISIADAEAYLVKALLADMIAASGLTDGNAFRERISRADWLDLEFAEENGRVLLRSRGGLLIRHIAFPTDAMLKVWPRRAEPLPHYDLPSLKSPHEPGYMPLFCAAHWIAARGGAVDIDPSDEAVWPHAYAALLARIASEQVRVIGLRSGDMEPVAGFHFATCPVSYLNRPGFAGGYLL